MADDNRDLPVHAFFRTEREPDRCDICRVPMEPDLAQWIHEDDCPQFRWDSDYCLCDRTVCDECCPDCHVIRRVFPLRGMLAVLIVAVMLWGVTTWATWHHDTQRAPCPDRNNACIFQPKP